MKTPIKPLSPLLCLLLAACGSLGTRSPRGHNGPEGGLNFEMAAKNPGETCAFGWAPYLGVAIDLRVVGTAIVKVQPSDLFGGLISLPVDAAVDTIFLPVDLVAWAGGRRKLSKTKRLPPYDPEYRRRALEARDKRRAKAQGGAEMTPEDAR